MILVAITTAVTVIRTLTKSRLLRKEGSGPDSPKPLARLFRFLRVSGAKSQEARANIEPLLECRNRELKDQARMVNDIPSNSFAPLSFLLVTRHSCGI